MGKEEEEETFKEELQEDTRSESHHLLVDILVQFYYWFKFHFILFPSDYHTLPYCTLKQKKIQIEPRTK